jgi:hypothetical protein
MFHSMFIAISFISLLEYSSIFAQPSRIIFDQRSSYNDIKAIRNDEVFEVIRKSLTSLSIKDTTTLNIRFLLRRAYGSLTEERNYQPLQGENYKHTWGPPTAFKNDKTRETYIEKFEIAVVNLADEIIWQGGYAMEVNIKIQITEKQKKQILKRMERAARKFRPNKIS